MSIEESDALDAYKELSSIIRDTGLSWLISDVDRQIELGKSTKKKIEIPDSERRPNSHLQSKQDNQVKPKKSRGKSVSVVVAEGYSAKERLVLLIDAVEAVVPGLSMAVLETISFIDSKLEKFSALGFCEDREDGETRELPKVFQNHKEVIGKLFMNLRDLKEAIQ